MYSCMQTLTSFLIFNAWSFNAVISSFVVAAILCVIYRGEFHQHVAVNLVVNVNVIE
jgi:hypothetical protein